MSSELRARIRNIIQEAVRDNEGGCLIDPFAEEYADRILAIPEIAEALDFTREHYERLGVNLGHSISTNPPR